MNPINNPSNIQTRSVVANAERNIPVNHQPVARSSPPTDGPPVPSREDQLPSEREEPRELEFIADGAHNRSSFHPPRNTLARNQASHYEYLRHHHSVSDMQVDPPQHTYSRAQPPLPPRIDQDMEADENGGEERFDGERYSRHHEAVDGEHSHHGSTLDNSSDSDDSKPPLPSRDTKPHLHDASRSGTAAQSCPTDTSESLGGASGPLTSTEALHRFLATALSTSGPSSDPVFNSPARGADSPHCSSSSVFGLHGYPLSPSLQSLPDTLPYNWQANKSTVKERIASMFNNHTMSDVVFLVGKESKRIPAHKFVLAVSSAVFDAMFFGPLAAHPTSSSDVTEIAVPDVEPSAFLILLKFIYSDEVHLNPETVMTTLYTAKKYAVPALEEACVEFLQKNLSTDNAFMLLTQARLFDELELAKECMEVIDKNTSEALISDSFADIDQATLCSVLERDTLGVREVKLFLSVVRWAEAECQRQGKQVTSPNLREAMAAVLPLVRFPLMSIDEFANCVAQTKLLSDRELVQMFLYFLVNPKPPVPFIDAPRCCLTGREQVVGRFCAVEQRWGYSGTSDRIRFMVNRKIFVVGFALYGSVHGPSEYNVNIEIIHPESGGVLGSNDTTFQCDGSNSTFRVIFKEPVEILPNVNYVACSTLKGADSYYGTKGLRKITHESLANGKVTFQFAYAAGNNNGTSVEDGQIPEIIFYM